jgi:hypothetical protein
MRESIRPDIRADGEHGVGATGARRRIPLPSHSHPI